MKPPIRLTVVQTHPVQYMAPWFRHIASHCPEIELHVVYASQPTPAQQGSGFGRPFEWDIPLTDGYSNRVVRPAMASDSFSSEAPHGLDVPEIVPALMESKPDVVLISGWHSVTQRRAIRACQRAKIPLLYRGDTHLGNAPAGFRRLLWELRTRWLLHRFSAYLAVGSRVRDYLRHFGVPPTRIFRSPHCVDNNWFREQTAVHQAPEARRRARQALGLPIDGFVVLFVGKLEAIKRPLDLLQATARLGADTALLLVGSGPLEAACRAAAAELNLRVAWPGFLNQSELGQAYACADCLALPSERETWGLVVNEALATGLPCVVSDQVGCAPDLVIPGKTGAVFRRGDITGLASAIATLRDERLTGHNFGPACRAHAEKHSHEAATTGLLAAAQAVPTHRDRRQSRVKVIACCGSMAYVSGLERMTFEVLDTLRKRGGRVHCIVNTWANSERPHEPHPIVELAERIGASWSTGYYWYPFDRHTRNPVRWMQLSWDILCTSVGLLRDAVRLRASQVMIPDFSTALRNAPTLLLLRLAGLRVVLRLANPPEPGDWYRRLWRWVVNPLVGQFVANSEFTLTELLAHGIPAKKACRIYNTLPSRNPQPVPVQPTGTAKVIFVGQIIPEKGVDVLLEAMAMLVKRGLDVRLEVVGSMTGWEPPRYTGYRDRLRTRAALPDLEGRVQFLGYREDVPILLAGARVHCCPSMPEQREGFGLVTLEAKHAGLPSVVFPTGALPELVGHRNDGWVCKETTASALAEGLEWFLTDEKRRAAAGEAARQSAARFNREHFATAWSTVFETPL